MRPCFVATECVRWRLKHFLTLLQIHDDLERSFREGYSVNIEKRVETLKNLTYMLHENSDLIQSALEADLGKRRQEAYVTEIFSCINSAINAVHKVRGWAAPHRVSAKFLFQDCSGLRHSAIDDTNNFWIKVSVNKRGNGC